MPPNLLGLYRLYNLSKLLLMGKLKNRTSTSTAEGVLIIPSPNPDKTTQPQQAHKQWLETQENHTIIICTDGSKLYNGSTGCGWAIYYCGDQHLSAGRRQLSSRQSGLGVWCRTPCRPRGSHHPPQHHSSTGHCRLLHRQSGGNHHPQL